MGAELDFLDHLELESARFAEAINSAPPRAQVPSCPDWNADDLLWHLAEVQWFWGTVVRDGLDGAAAEQRKPPRPEGRAALMSFYLSASADLGAALSSAAPETPAWTWADDKTVGFIRRRQAHEALIHRLDAELTAGHGRAHMDPALSADGTDEALRIMYGGDLPTWGTFAADDARAISNESDSVNSLPIRLIARPPGRIFWLQWARWCRGKSRGWWTTSPQDHWPRAACLVASLKLYWLRFAGSLS